MSSSRSRRGKRCRQRPLKPGCQAALATEAGIREAAVGHGIRLLTSTLVGRGRRSERPTLHWRFATASNRELLAYWPARGTVFASGQRGRARDAWHALQMAVAVNDGMSPERAMRLVAAR